MMEIPSGVRKGTWSKEEDDLLRACIQRYGEGTWRLVPQRAGLNRCRKSCRLRWLSYLKPDIKRGNFTEDEADMIMRFHKLLGNRWSLIAARFPGRTSNDVKNYWNTHIRKKQRWFFSENKEKQEGAMKSPQVIRPKPLNLLRNSSRPRKGLAEASAANTCDNDKRDDGGGSRDKPVIIATDSDSNKSDESGEVVVGADSLEKTKEEWWESLLNDVNGGNEKRQVMVFGKRGTRVSGSILGRPTTSLFL